MLDTKHSFISAYLKGEEAKTVTSDHINRMSAVSSVQDVLGIIGETDIGSCLEQVPIATFDDVDRSLWEYFGGCLQRLESFKPVPKDIRRILGVYIVKYDISNTKAALQAISADKKASLIPIGLMHNQGLLGELSRTENIDGIIALLIAGKLGDYAAVLRGYEVDGGERSKLLTEAGLDNVYHSSLLNVSKGMKDGFILSRVFGVMIDLKNLQVILRVIIEEMGPEAVEYIIGGGYIIAGEMARDLMSLKLTDVPGRLSNTQYHDMVKEVVTTYNDTNSITVVEEIIDKYKFNWSKEILSPRVLSPLDFVWYAMLKECEISNLRLILKAMFDNIPFEQIRAYLVLPS